jgi:small subunit ribosomal protein S2
VNYRWLGGMLTNFQTVPRPGGEDARARAARRDRARTEQMIKKEGLKVKRELAKLERNLGGIRTLEKAPDAVFVIDTKKEHIAVTEANRSASPVIAVVDTNCDPDSSTT